jgi:hypothetical protein
MSIYDREHLIEAGAETPTLDTRSEEDPKLYQDAEGGHAKIDTDKGTEGKDKKNRSSIAGKAPITGIESPVPSGTSQERLEQHLTALFDGEELSESFQNKAATIFEAAINERVVDIEENLMEQYQNILTESVEDIAEELSEKLDDYLGYVVEQWMEDNELVVENGIRTDVAENFISGLKILFENCYIDVPEERYNIVEELANDNDRMTNDLNEALQSNVDLRAGLLKQRCDKILNEETYGLTDIEAERLQSLAEGIEYDDEDSFRNKILTLRESYFKNDPLFVDENNIPSSQPEMLVEDDNVPMNKYMNTISRHSNYNKTQ